MRALCSKEQSPGVSCSPKVLSQPFSATGTLPSLLSGGMVCMALTHLLTSCSSESKIQAAVLWVWGHLFLTTRLARPHGGWKASPPQPTARRYGSPGGPRVLGCIYKEKAVPVSRSILSRCPWTRWTGEHQRSRQPGKGFLLLPVLKATRAPCQHLHHPALLRLVGVLWSTGVLWRWNLGCDPFAELCLTPSEQSLWICVQRAHP